MYKNWKHKPSRVCRVTINSDVDSLFLQLLEDTCYTILNSPKPKPKVEPPPPPKEEEKKQDGAEESTNEEKMEQDGGNAEKTTEQQGEQDDEGKKFDPDMDIDWR